MLRNTQIPWNSIIQFSAAGIVIADFAQIRKAITEQFKRIYGDDIDLSTSSADGIYVETYCLVINNILQSFKQLYANLDVRTAPGKFLEILCALSNVSRKQETFSTASLIVTLDTSEQSYSTKSLSFVDINGNEWIASSIEDMTFLPGVPQTIVVTCTTPGPVRADAGWIDKTLTLDVIMDVEQPDDAILGSYAETDTQLRARRTQSLGATGNSVLESLAGALLDITGIDDIKIYNNDTLTTIHAKDTTAIESHAVYVVIRKKENVEIANSLLGSLIYEKMTPGIPTTETQDNVNGLSQNFKYQQYVLGTPIDAGIVQNVYWKQAKPIAPSIQITITPKEQFASANDSTLNAIKTSLFNYLNNLSISEDIDKYDVYDSVKYADPQFRGRATFTIDSILINGADSNYINPDVFFDYTDAQYETSNGKKIITLYNNELVGDWTISNLNAVIVPEYQTMLIYAFNDEAGTHVWLPITVDEEDNRRAQFFVPSAFNQFIFVVFNGNVEPEDADWSNMIKQSGNIQNNLVRNYDMSTIQFTNNSRLFTIGYVDDKIDVSNQFMFAWCWPTGGEGAWINATIIPELSGSGHRAYMIIPEQYQNFLLMVSNSNVPSWDTAVRQTSDIAINSTREYWANDLYWEEKMAVYAMLNEPATMSLDDELDSNEPILHWTIPTPFLEEIYAKEE